MSTTRYWMTAWLLLAPAHWAGADGTLSERTIVVFATVQQGRKVLGQKDDFVQRMSPFDRAARMKTDQAVSEKQYLAFVAGEVLPWNEDETARVEAALRGVKRGLTGLALDLPETVYLIKTTGNEEGGAAYTRANAIILPQSMLGSAGSKLQSLIAHELFHVLSRNDPELREELYAVIGFRPCNEIEFPAALNDRKLTNPDAPRNDHYIRVTRNGQMVSAVPILLSRTPKYDVGSGRAFFHYLQFRLLIVQKNAEGDTYHAVYEGQEPVLAEVNDLSGFYEQVGRNTRYIIHPEEILADNFALLVMGKGNAPSPRILEKMREVLSKNRPEHAEPTRSPDA